MMVFNFTLPTYSAPRLDAERLGRRGGVAYLRRWAQGLGLVVYATGCPWGRRGPGGSWRRLLVFTCGGHTSFDVRREGGVVADATLLDEFKWAVGRHLEIVAHEPATASAVAEAASASYGPAARETLDLVAHRAYRDAPGAQTNTILAAARVARRQGMFD